MSSGEAVRRRDVAATEPRAAAPTSGEPMKKSGGPRSLSPRPRDDQDSGSQLLCVLATVLVMIILGISLSYMLYNQVVEELEDHTEHAPNIDTRLRVGLADMFRGAKFTIGVERQTTCTRCSGTGAHSPNHIRRCEYCDGRGAVIQNVQIFPGMVQKVQQRCRHCGGEGSRITKRCSKCHGRGVYMEEAKVEVDVPRGSVDGNRLQLRRQGHQQPGISNGHLNLELVSERDDVFVRKGMDLFTELEVSLKEALTGFNYEIEHLDGRKVSIFNNDVTQHDEVLTIAGEGWSCGDAIDKRLTCTRGNLYVKVKVDFPDYFERNEKEELERVLATLPVIDDVSEAPDHDDDE